MTAASVARPPASLSLDLDNAWSYLKTHGDRWDHLPSYLDIVVPRVLAFLAERGLRITVFVVGQDAALERHRDVLASIAAAGHEIGNHSYSHEPWLHRDPPAAAAREIERAEDAILDATGVRPIGFRGPGYSVSPAVLETLVARGYEYDASTLPTMIGPLARWVYFRSAHLSDAERDQRSDLFGRFRDRFRPLDAYRWRTAQGSIVELPVTTFPALRVPMHVSYLLALSQRSPGLARKYFATALRACRLSKVGPSLLLHPLDFLDAADVPELAFFPGLVMPAARKHELVGEWIDMFSDRYAVATVADHVKAASNDSLATVDAQSLLSPMRSRLRPRRDR